MSISTGIFFTFATYPGTRDHSLKLALPDSRMLAHIALQSELYQYEIACPMMLSQLHKYNYTCLKNRLSKTNLAYALRGK